MTMTYYSGRKYNERCFCSLLCRLFTSFILLVLILCCNFSVSFPLTVFSFSKGHVISRESKVYEIGLSFNKKTNSKGLSGSFSSSKFLLHSKGGELPNSVSEFKFFIVKETSASSSRSRSASLSKEESHYEIKINDNSENEDKGESNSSKNNRNNIDYSGGSANINDIFLSDDLLLTKSEGEEETEISLETAHFDDGKYKHAYKITHTENINLLEERRKQERSKKRSHEFKVANQDKRKSMVARIPDMFGQFYQNFQLLNSDSLKGVFRTKKDVLQNKKYLIDESFSVSIRNVMKSTATDIKDRSLSFLSPFVSIFRQTFLPVDYPHSVSPDYLPYQGWNLIQDVSTYLRGILATKAILEGVGVGREGATALAATLQWVARDGTSMLGGLLFTSLFSSNLATNIKKWRLVADISVDIGITLEMIAPLYQSFFLSLICLASIAKSICGIAAGATGAQINQHWSLTGNLADISAKSSAQHTAISFLSLGLGVLFAKISSENKIILWGSYITLTIIHLFANYKAMRTLAFNTLNTERLEVLLSEYIKKVVGKQNIDVLGSLPIYSTTIKEEDTAFLYSLVDSHPNEAGNENIDNNDLICKQTNICNSNYDPSSIKSMDNSKDKNGNVSKIISQNQQKQQHQQLQGHGTSIKESFVESSPFSTRNVAKKEKIFIDSSNWMNMKRKHLIRTGVQLKDLFSKAERIGAINNDDNDTRNNNNNSYPRLYDLIETQGIIIKKKSFPFLLAFDENTIKISFSSSITTKEKISAYMAAMFLQYLLFSEKYRGHLAVLSTSVKLDLVRKALLFTKKHERQFFLLLKNNKWEVSDEKEILLGNDEKWRVDIESPEPGVSS